MSILQNMQEVLEGIENSAAKSGRKAGEVQLVAVSKTVEPARILQAVEAGATMLGENRVQEWKRNRKYFLKIFPGTSLGDCKKTR